MCRYQSPLPADKVKPFVEYDNEEGTGHVSLCCPCYLCGSVCFLISL